MFQGRCGSCLVPPSCSIRHMNTVRTKTSTHRCLNTLKVNAFHIVSGEDNSLFQASHRVQKHLQPLVWWSGWSLQPDRLQESLSVSFLDPKVLQKPLRQGLPRWETQRFLLNLTEFCRCLDLNVPCCVSVCPGGVENPCGSHGDCDDGVTGSGVCKCHKGFKGKSCELCVSGYYGANCTGTPETTTPESQTQNPQKMLA